MPHDADRLRLGLAAATIRAARGAILAVALALPLVAVGCDAGAVPATPPITPGLPAAPRQVNVILKDYLFEPPIVDLVPGETIRLNVVNGGLDTHELVIGTQAVQDAWAAAERPAANPPPGPTPVVAGPAGLEGVRIVVASGETRSITWTVPADAGSLLLGCHIADHYERGMAGLVRAVGPGGSPLATPSGSPGPIVSAVP